MSDMNLVEFLRYEADAADSDGVPDTANGYRTAANEIEQLREERDQYREAAEIFRDFGRFAHLRTDYDQGEYGKAMAILTTDTDSPE